MEIDLNRVCIVLIHQGIVHYRTSRWIERQLERGAKLVCHSEPALLQHENPLIKKYLNCAKARNNARLEAIKTGADYFMFLDADVVPPVNALDHFLLQKTPVRGGWYAIKTKIQHNEHLAGGGIKVEVVRRWVAGRWVDHNRMLNFLHPRTTRLFKSDILPAGCCMVDRIIAELVPFEHGTDIFYTDDATGQQAVLGECGLYANRLHELGEPVWMNPAIICDHEDFNQPNPTKQISISNKHEISHSIHQ